MVMTITATAPVKTRPIQRRKTMATANTMQAITAAAIGAAT